MSGTVLLSAMFCSAVLRTEPSLSAVTSKSPTLVAIEAPSLLSGHRHGGAGRSVDRTSGRYGRDACEQAAACKHCHGSPPVFALGPAGGMDATAWGKTPGNSALVRPITFS